MFSCGITFIVWHEVSFVLTQTQSNNQKFIAFTLRYKQDLFFNKNICCNLLLSRTSPLDHMETMLKNSDISKNPNVACFQKERESVGSLRPDRDSGRVGWARQRDSSRVGGTSPFQHVVHLYVEQTSKVDQGNRNPKTPILCHWHRSWGRLGAVGKSVAHSSARHILRSGTNSCCWMKALKEMCPWVHLEQQGCTEPTHRSMPTHLHCTSPKDISFCFAKVLAREQ